MLRLLDGIDHGCGVDQTAGLQWHSGTNAAVTIDQTRACKHWQTGVDQQR